MGLLPSAGEGEGAAARPRLGFSTVRESNDVAPILKIQAMFMIAGSAVGVLGVVLPHPDSFLAPQLLVLNIGSIVLALGVWMVADRIPEPIARITPAIGTLAVTLAVIFSRDPTSAYALLYVFICVYAYYFMRARDALFHVLFAVVNYAAAIAVLGALDGAIVVSSGSIVHHYVITIGNLVLVGLMLVYLRRKVEGLMSEIIESARTDLLTGLLNGRGAMEALTAELDRARMNAHRVALLTLEVGGMREVRAKSGGAKADRALKDLGAMLDDSTRRIDRVARIGSTEFTVILPETDEGTAFLLAEQILTRFRRAYRERNLGLVTSIGIASFPKHAAGAEELSQAASSACQAAKMLGADRAVVFSAELETVVGGDPRTQLGERRAHLSTVLSLAEVLDLRDPRTIPHSLAVSRYAEMIAEELGLPESRVQRLRLAGMLHDIGKVGIADAILSKPGPLSPAEWDEVRRHPEMAARILASRELTDIREWILKRHEQPDGHGYPSGLRGDEIPLESRILAVAESYDAMTSDRAYRKRRTAEQAISELGRYAGSQFDGRVVDAFVRAMARAAEAAEV